MGRTRLLLILLPLTLIVLLQVGITIAANTPHKLTDTPPTQTITPTADEDNVARVTAPDDVIIYVSADESYNQAGTLTRGYSATIIRTLPDQSWLQIEVESLEGLSGWVRADEVEISGSLADVPQVVPPTGPPAVPRTPEPTRTATPIPGEVTLTTLVPTNVYINTTLYNGAENILGTLTADVSIPVVGYNPRFQEWVQIEYEGSFGWVYTQFVSIEGELTTLPDPVFIPSSTPTRPFLDPTQEVIASTATAFAEAGIPTPTATVMPSPTFIPTQQPNDILNLIVVPDLPPQSMTDDELQQSITIIGQRLQAYGIADHQVSYGGIAQDGRQQLIISVSDNGTLLDNNLAYTRLLQRGVIEVVNLNSLDTLALRQAYLNQCVYTQFTAQRLNADAFEAIDVGITTFEFSRFFYQSFVQSLCRFDPITNRPFVTHLHQVLQNTGVTFAFEDNRWVVTINMQEIARSQLENFTIDQINGFTGVALDGNLLDIRLLNQPLQTISIPARTEQEARIIKAIAETRFMPIGFQLIQAEVVRGILAEPTPPVTPTESVTPNTPQVSATPTPSPTPR